MTSLLRSFLDTLRGQRPRLVAYRIERLGGEPIEATALAIAILGAGFRVDEQRRCLVVSRTHERDRAIVPLPRSRVVGAEPLAIRASDRDLVLGLMTAMSAVLGALRLQTAELGEVVVNAPSDAVSPDTQRRWAAARRTRVASHYAVDRGPRRPGR